MGLYDAVPKSSIVFVDGSDDTGIEMFKQKAQLLFHKYIRANAEFEVNISYAMRMEYTRMAEQHWAMTAVQLANVFDIVMIEMVSFMKQSFNRYQSHAIIQMTDPVSSASVEH